MTSMRPRSRSTIEIPLASRRRRKASPDASEPTALYERSELHPRCRFKGTRRPRRRKIEPLVEGENITIRLRPLARRPIIKSDFLKSFPSRSRPLSPLSSTSLPQQVRVKPSAECCADPSCSRSWRCWSVSRKCFFFFPSRKVVERSSSFAALRRRRFPLHLIP